MGIGWMNPQVAEKLAQLFAELIYNVALHGESRVRATINVAAFFKSTLVAKIRQCGVNLTGQADRLFHFWFCLHYRLHLSKRTVCLE